MLATDTHFFFAAHLRGVFLIRDVLVMNSSKQMVNNAFMRSECCINSFTLQRSAVEGAYFESQSFGALVVCVGDNPAVQAHTTALGKVLRDVENDNYVEKIEWVAAKDSADNAQGLLVLDFNQNGLIETRDILNLGGNIRQDGSPTNEAALATQNADLQLNNVELDADGDGKLTAQDPAFAVDAGTVLEHKGYQGKVQITDEGDTCWASECDPTQVRQLDSVEHPGSLTEDQQAANAASLLSNFAYLGTDAANDGCMRGVA